MKKIAFFALAAALVMTGCDNKKLEQQQAQIDSLAQANKMTAEELQNYVELVNSISESLDFINEAEQALKQLPGEGTAQQKRQVLKEKVANLANVVSTQRDRIAKLEAMISKGGKEAGKLQNIIEMMKTQLDEKEQMIAQLMADVENKNASIATLTTNVENLTTQNTQLNQTIDTQQQEITTKTNQMNEAYVKVATKDELKALGLLEGGFLKKKTLNASNIDKSKFKQVDQRTFSQVNIPAKKVKVLSHMPESSYRLESNGETTLLTITDAAKFWSITNCLIIQY